MPPRPRPPPGTRAERHGDAALDERSATRPTAVCRLRVESPPTARPAHPALATPRTAPFAIPSCPHDGADLARSPLARLPPPTTRTPPPWPRRLRRDSVSPTDHRLNHQAESVEIHPTARVARAGRRLHTAPDTSRAPAQQLDPKRPDQRRLTPVHRRRNPLLIAVAPGQSRLPRNHPRLALQAGVAGSSPARSTSEKALNKPFCRIE